MTRRPKQSPSSAAECKGHEIAHALLEEIAPLKAYEEQAEAIRALQNAILDICELPRRDRVAGGFAVAITCFLQRGMGVRA
jgi:hypothetical protein